jgi:hypothetical protein
MKTCLDTLTTYRESNFCETEKWLEVCSELKMVVEGEEEGMRRATREECERIWKKELEGVETWKMRWTTP